MILEADVQIARAYRPDADASSPRRGRELLASVEGQ